MSSRHLYCGRKESTGEWVTGRAMFLENNEAVIREEDGTSSFIERGTLRQSTGRVDEKKVRIFEGDLVRSEQGEIFCVKFGPFTEEGTFFQGIGFYLEDSAGLCASLPCDDWLKLERVGNRWDDPELWKEAENHA